MDDQCDGKARPYGKAVIQDQFRLAHLCPFGFLVLIDRRWLRRGPEYNCAGRNRRVASPGRCEGRCARGMRKFKRLGKTPDLPCSSNSPGAHALAQQPCQWGGVEKTTVRPDSKCALLVNKKRASRKTDRATDELSAADAAEIRQRTPKFSLAGWWIERSVEAKRVRIHGASVSWMRLGAARAREWKPSVAVGNSFAVQQAQQRRPFLVHLRAAWPLELLEALA